MKATLLFRLLVLLWSLCHLFGCTSIYGQGIQLTGSTRPIELRSSVRLFEADHPTFKEFFTIAFDVHLKDDGSAGYILRLKDEGARPTYNLYVDREDGQAVFRFNEEGKSCLIRVAIDMNRLKSARWMPIALTYNLLRGSISLAIGDMAAKEVAAPVSSGYAPVVSFGKSDYLIDVPSFSLRALEITDAERRLAFPMRESSGRLLHDESGIAYGQVSKATWLVNHAYHWQKSYAAYSQSRAGSDYHPGKQLAYYFNQDSLYIHHLREGRSEAIRFTQPCPLLLKLGNSFVDTAENRLYVYETLYEHPHEGPTVASLNLSDYTWRVESHDYPAIELNHHAAQYLPALQQLLVFGGFGHMLYTNKLMRYPLQNSEWTTPKPTTGSVILPRYFTSMGLSETTEKLYLFGGMGNESGEHIVGRKYFYDLYEIDPKTGHSKRLWQVDWREKNFVPGRGLVIPDQDWVYMLGYPEHVSHSLIKLRRFSLHDGRYEELGDSIPIYSDKISTRARLYHDHKLQKLVALVQESDDDIRSKLSVYELEFPAISQAQLHAFPGHAHRHNRWAWLCGVTALLAGVALVGLYWLRRRKRTQLPARGAELPVINNSNLDRSIRPASSATTGMHEIRADDTLPRKAAPDHTPRQEQEFETQPTLRHPDKNAIFLFGDFTVLDRRGTDISHVFSARLRQVFCLILLHNEGEGISSALLSHLIWPDKPKDKVKTSRGVTINNLRKALASVEGAEIIYENGHYRVSIAAPCYCDYTTLMKETGTEQDEPPGHIRRIVRRGTFLLGFDDALFDKIKGDLEATSIAKFQQVLLQEEQQQNWPSMLEAAELILAIDPVHELGFMKGIKALSELGADRQMNRFYQRFIEQYRLLLGEDYPYSLEHILARLD